MGQYQPEMGQIVFGDAHGTFEVPRYARSLLHGILDQIEVTFWNTHHRSWDRVEDPRVSGITFRPYCWGETDEARCTLPNFTVDGFEQELRWYKHAGRGLSCTAEWTPEQWVAWFAAAMDRVDAANPSPFK